ARALAPRRARRAASPRRGGTARNCRGDRMNGSGSGLSLRRIEREFLRPHRAALGLALAGLLAQSLLGLPVPLIQGWVVDRLVPYLHAGASAVGDRAALGRSIAAALAAMLACHVGRMALGWKVSALMSRVTLEV